MTSERSRPSSTSTSCSHDVDGAAISAATVAQAGRETSGIGGIASYCDEQNADASHREILGPLLPATGASGVVLHRGARVAEWGRPDAVEMAFSVTKTFVSAVAGLAYDEGLLDLHAPVNAGVDHPALASAAARGVTWHHLLQQTSQWQGELWAKPTGVDAQSRDAGKLGSPGSGWAYNDVRVNLLCLALTALWRRSLPAILGERILEPIGASASWSWHGYTGAIVDVGDTSVPVVSGGAHWGGGMWISADDLARFGELYLYRGACGGRQLLSEEWVERSWTPCEIKPEYGYLWWLNHSKRVFPSAPGTGCCARGNLGRHLLWVDPARDIVIASRWGDEVHRLLREVSRAIGCQQ